MTHQIRTCRRFQSVGPFQYSSDFADAGSPISVRFLIPGIEDEPNEGWRSTPFQAADARCDPRVAERMIARYFR